MLMPMETTMKNMEKKRKKKNDYELYRLLI